MEPFEWLLLLGGVAIGGLLGANGKGVMRNAARGYLTLEEKAKSLSANMREDFRDAVEEARYERTDDEAPATRSRGRGEVAAADAPAATGRRRTTRTPRVGGARRSTGSRTRRGRGAAGAGGGEQAASENA